MRLLQVIDGRGRIRPGVIQGEQAVLVAPDADSGIHDTCGLLVAADRGETTIDAWLARADADKRTTRTSWEALAGGDDADGWRLTIPLTPPEVWGCGVTYRRSADFREEGHGFYDGVYDAPRPELFYKASPARSVGPGEPIGRRRDSNFTAAEPEVALVVSAEGRILGYTLANDVSAWDIERENPLYLPQSKIYTGCFSCGPTIVTPDEIADPYALELTCSVLRGMSEVFHGSASTAQLKRKFPELIRWLRESNTVPAGTILSSGTGIIQPIGSGLEPGDVVTISCPELGDLTNPVALV
jgi:2-dehydro-3-deoxy-D-arabinonate dehydratase